MNQGNEVRIRRVPKKIKAELMNISKNLDVSISDLLKPAIEQFVASQPERLKKEPLKD